MPSLLVNMINNKTFLELFYDKQMHLTDIFINHLLLSSLLVNKSVCFKTFTLIMT